MTNFLIACLVPFILILLLVGFAVRRNIMRPSPRPFGSIIPRVCVVNSDEVIQYQARLKEEQRPASRRRRREVRRQQGDVYWRFLRQMIFNTRLFQQAVGFEKLKIDPGKSSLEYEPRETLIFELVEETAAMRVRLVNWKLRLQVSRKLGLPIRPEEFREMVAAYKNLEQDIIALAGMADDSVFRDMLIENLGLSRWQIIPGGSESS